MTREDFEAWSRLLREKYGIAYPMAPEEGDDDGEEQAVEVTSAK